MEQYGDVTRLRVSRQIRNDMSRKFWRQVTKAKYVIALQLYDATFYIPSPVSFMCIVYITTIQKSFLYP